jgi:hypothetical protein
MSRVEWIVCERSGRWAAAVRAALGRSAWPPSNVPRVYEVRQLGELRERLAERPDGLALVEAQRESFGDTLAWLAEAVRENRSAQFIALVDRGVWGSVEQGAVTRQRDRRLVVVALREAGAADVVTSPRQLGGLLALGERHASLRATERGGPASTISIAEWAWASLPWQTE